MKKQILFLATLLIFSVVTVKPAGAKENSPPRHEAIAHLVASPIDAIIELESIETVTIVNTPASVMADNAYAQEYASHNPDVDYAPLYRRPGTYNLLQSLKFHKVYNSIIYCGNRAPVPKE